MKNYSAGL